MTSFLELIEIYRWSIPAAVLMAGVLALIGAQWTARDKSAQIFVLGQGASLGIVIGLILNLLMGTDIHGLNLFLGLTLGWITLLFSDLLIQTRSSRNHIYLTLFVFFLSLTYLLSYVTPALETHIASSYFGDLAVMSDTAAMGAIMAGLIFGGFTLFHWRRLSLISFQMANQSLITQSLPNRIFDLGTLLVTTMSIQSMGYLYTMGSLFIATSFAASQSRNLHSYVIKVMLISFGGSAAGFALSLLSTNLPTVPCVILGQILMGLIFYTKK